MIAELWQYMDGTEPSSPTSWERLLELLRRNTISPDTLVRREGSEAWFGLGRILSDPALSPPPPSFAISRAGDASSAGASSQSGIWVDMTAHPWRRYVARMIDTTIYAAAGFYVTGIILATTDISLSYRFVDLLSGLSGRLISAFLGFIYAILGGALVIGFTSGSFGKWLMGVRVVDASYRPIGIPRALLRELLVWVKGLGFGIPFVTLVTLVMAYRRLDGDAITSWDDKLGLVVLHRPRGVAQTVLGIVGIALYVAAVVALRWPYRGQ
jgi:uncharacterized RDD family membrane protein YckC